MAAADVVLVNKSHSTTESDGTYYDVTAHELFHRDKLLWRKESLECTTPKGDTFGSTHVALLSRDKTELTVQEKPSEGGTAGKKVYAVADLLSATAAVRHRALLQGSGVSADALAAFSSPSTPLQQFSSPPTAVAGSFRVLDWNLLADGLSDDGFAVTDVLDRPAFASANMAPIDDAAMIHEVMATKKAKGDMAEVQAKSRRRARG